MLPRALATGTRAREGPEAAFLLSITRMLTGERNLRELADPVWGLLAC